VLPSVVVATTPSKFLACIQISELSFVFSLMVANTGAYSRSSCRVLRPFCLIDHQSYFGVLIAMSCLRSCSGNFKGLSCVHELFLLCEHRSYSQVSSRLFKDLSQVSHLSLLTFNTISLSTCLSCWFELSYR